MKNILRNFWITISRFRTASFLNILGLTVALAVFMVIISQAYWELTYNKGIKQHEQVFRLVKNDGEDLWLVFSRPFAEAIGKTSPEIETFAATGHWVYNILAQTLDINEQTIETKTNYTRGTPAITEVLSLKCLSGDFKRLEEPKAAMIAKSVADILFSEGDPIGNRIILPDFKDTLQIVAIYKDLPQNCTFKNGIFSNLGDVDINQRHNSSYVYYYKLNSPNAKLEVESQAKKIYQEIYATDKDEDDEDDEEETLNFYLEPLLNLYYSEATTFHETGNWALTRLLITIAIVIVLIAVINYINFFMALVPIRIRSVNINKVFGTPTASLRLNIIGEAVGLLLLSFGLALLLVQYLFDTSVGELIVASLKIGNNLFIVFTTFIMITIVGILAGLFPAFFITKYNPALVLKGSFGRGVQGKLFRNILVTFQFTISTILIIGASFLYLQNRFMQKYDYGFNRDRLVTVQVGGKIASQPQTFLSELKKNPAIEGIAYAFTPILNIGIEWGRSYNGETIHFSNMPVSWNYPEFMGLTLVEGRFFIEDDASKTGGTIIFNETAAKQYGIKVGDFIYGHHWKENAEIVGIVNHFNFTSLQNNIEPLAIYEFGSAGWFLPSVAHIRLSPKADFKQTADFIASCMKEVNPEMKTEEIVINPFDETIENLYTKEIKLTKIISLFSLVAVIISLMGVFGIVVFENQHRKKEIALRKIHGSTVALILGMFNRKFLYILLISFVIAAPIAYYGVTKWLSGFAYKTPVYWWIFAVGFLVVAFITSITVTLQTLSVANENPIKAIKQE
jgi:putative ABC transport system permease protein